MKLISFTLSLFHSYTLSLFHSYTHFPVITSHNHPSTESQHCWMISTRKPFLRVAAFLVFFYMAYRCQSMRWYKANNLAPRFLFS